MGPALSWIAPDGENLRKEELLLSSWLIIEYTIDTDGSHNKSTA